MGKWTFGEKIWWLLIRLACVGILIRFILVMRHAP